MTDTAPNDVTLDADERGGLATVAVYLILRRWAGTAGWRRIVRRA